MGLSRTVCEINGDLRLCILGHHGAIEIGFIIIISVKKPHFFHPRVFNAHAQWRVPLGIRYRLKGSEN